jgi:hypothetical protein
VLQYRSCYPSFSLLFNAVARELQPCSPPPSPGKRSAGIEQSRNGRDYVMRNFRDASSDAYDQCPRNRVTSSLSALRTDLPASACFRAYHIEIAARIRLSTPIGIDEANADTSPGLSLPEEVEGEVVGEMPMPAVDNVGVLLELGLFTRGALRKKKIIHPPEYIRTYGES